MFPITELQIMWSKTDVSAKKSRQLNNWRRRFETLNN
jgi:hypothetical protein